MLTEIALTPDMEMDVILAKLMAAVEHRQEDATEMKLEVKFSNGAKLEWKLGSKKDKEGKKEEESDDEQENEDESSDEIYPGLKKLEVDIKLVDDAVYKLSASSDKGEIEAEVESDLENEVVEADGEEALWYLTNLLETMDLAATDTDEVIQTKLLDALNIEFEQIEKLKVKAEFTNGPEIEIEL
jgi:hypothetical protein